MKKRTILFEYKNNVLTKCLEYKEGNHVTVYQKGAELRIRVR